MCVECHRWWDKSCRFAFQPLESLTHVADAAISMHIVAKGRMTDPTGEISPG